MSKSLTLSMSLAVALGFAGVSFAGHHGDAGCTTCGLASPQGVAASPQASAQSYETCDTCTTKKKHGGFKMPSCFKPKPKMYTYEWVLKKKKVHGHHGGESCDTCGSAVTPSAQYASPQGAYAAPQSYGTYGSHQTASAQPTSEMRAAEPAPAGDSVPPAPTTPAAPAPAPPAPPVPPATGAQSSLLFLAPAGN